MNIERKEQEDRSIDIKVRIAEIDAKFKSLLSSLSVDLEDNSHTEKAIAELMTEKKPWKKNLKSTRLAMHLPPTNQNSMKFVILRN